MSLHSQSAVAILVHEAMWSLCLGSQLWTAVVGENVRGSVQSSGVTRVNTQDMFFLGGKEASRPGKIIHGRAQPVTFRCDYSSLHFGEEGSKSHYYANAMQRPEARRRRLIWKLTCCHRDGSPLHWDKQCSGAKREKGGKKEESIRNSRASKVA